MNTPVLNIRLFGQIEIACDDTPLSIPRAGTACSLLAYLVIHSGRPIPRDVLAGAFWPDRSETHARRALSNTLWHIRRALGPAAGRLVTEGDTVTFALHPDDRLDITEFKASLARDETKTDGEPPLPTPHPLTAAVTLYRADFLEGCYDDWALLERERLRELYLAALEQLITRHKQQGAYRQALDYALRLAAADPLREAAHRELMRLYHLLGRDRAALQQYDTLRRLLADELGSEPLAATAALAREIAGQAGETEPPYLPVAARPAPLFDRPEHLPLVGRNRERAALLAHLAAAIDGQAGLVLVEGEAGVGKTRLLQEIARGAEWRGLPAGWGRNREVATAPPYGMFSDALSDVLSPLRADQLAGLLDGVWLREASRLLPQLAEWLPGLPPHVTLPPEQEQKRLREALRRLILALGQITPHLLLLEDLQWADEAGLAALDDLSPHLKTSRVLIIASCRSEEARDRPRFWEALQALERAGWERLELARLTVTETGELVRRGLGLVGPALRFEERLYRETEGNPLFVLETLHVLHDEGLLHRDSAGRWVTPWDETTADYAELPLPAGVSQVIARRLARLETDERAVLNVAAVLEAGFDFSLLAQAGDVERSAVLEAVSELLRRRLLVEEPTAYRFSHDKVRQVAYVGVEEAERRRLHRRAGRALEALRPEQVERLAHHFSLGQVWDKALEYNRQAGERARIMYAGTEAVNYYDQAFAAWEHLQPADEGVGLSLHQTRGEICQETGRFDQAEADFRAAYNLAEQRGDKAGQSRILNLMSYLWFQRGDFDSAATVAERAFELATAAGLQSEIATGLFNRANATRNLGYCQTAIGFYERAVTIYEELGDQMHLADALNRMGAAFYLIGDFAKARSLVERSLTIRRQLDDRVGISYSLINSGQLYRYRGQFARARKAAQEALEVARAIGDPYGEDAALSNLGTAVLEQGSPTQAIPFFQRALRIAGEIGDRALEPESLCELGRAYHHLSDLEQAREALEQALSMLLTGIDPFLTPRVHAHLARLFLAADRDDEALAHARAGLQETEKAKDPWSLGLTHRVMGETAVHLGAERAAAEPEPHFEKSIRILRDIGAQAELARSLAAYGLYLRRSAHADQAQRGATLLDEARALFQQLGMAGDLARLEAEAAARLLPGQIRVRLPHAEAPTGRPLRDDEWIEVTWTVESPQDAAIPGKACPEPCPERSRRGSRRGSRRVARRRQRILRLLREAADQGAAPTVEALAAALDVGVRTVKRDLAALRAAGHDARTRGSRNMQDVKRET